MSLSEDSNSEENYFKAFETFKENIENEEISIHVSNSIFKRCQEQGQGGAIYYTNENGKMLIEYSTFHNCFTIRKDSEVYYGGAASILDCDCVINCVCCSKCYATSSASQSFRIFPKSDDQLNFILSSSICLTPFSNNAGEEITQAKGKQYCNLVNISQNKVFSRSGIWFDHSLEKHFITYCSICSNEAQAETCIGIGKNTKGAVEEYYIKNCNIINNKQSSTSTNGGIITCYQTTITIINNCCILGNTDAKLFFVNTGAQVIIMDSTLPNEFSTTKSINTSNALTKPFINDLKLTSKEGYCFSGIDSYGTLTPYQYTTQIRQTKHIKQIQKHPNELKSDTKKLNKNIFILSDINEETNTTSSIKIHFKSNISTRTKLNITLQTHNEGNNSHESQSYFHSHFTSLLSYVRKHFHIFIFSILIFSPYIKKQYEYSN